MTRCSRADDTNAKAAPSDAVRVKFLLPSCFCQFNDKLRIVGSGAATGLWTADAAPEQDGQPGGYWSAEVQLPPGRYAFKVTTLRGDGTVDWEKGKSREFEVPANAGKTMLHTIPPAGEADNGKHSTGDVSAGKQAEARPLTINLERWFDVDALITGLEAKRRSLRSSIEELKIMVQGGDDQSGATNGATKPPKPTPQPAKPKQPSSNGAAAPPTNGSTRGGSNPRRTDANGAGSSGASGGDPLSTYTQRMQADEQQYMGRVWKDLVSEVVRPPAPRPGDRPPRPPPARGPAAAPAGQGEDKRPGSTRLSLQTAPPEGVPVQLAPSPLRAWVFEPRSGLYQSTGGQDPSEVDEDESRSVLPPGIPDPSHDFLLLDTDSIPLNLHTSTLAEAFGGVAQANPSPAMADTDSCAIPGHGEVTLPEHDMVLRCEGSPFSGMDFNEAFRIASSSFARPVLDDAGDMVPVQSRQHAPTGPQCSASSAALFAALGTLAGIDSMVRQHGTGTSSECHAGGGYAGGGDDLPVLEVVVDEAAMQEWLATPTTSSQSRRALRVVSAPYSGSLASPAQYPPPAGASSEGTTLGDIHECLKEISSRLETLMPGSSIQQVPADDRVVAEAQPAAHPVAASRARASASALVLRSQHLAAQHALRRQSRHAESMGALQQAVGVLLAPHLADPVDVVRAAGEDVLDSVVGAVLLQQTRRATPTECDPTG